MQQSLRAAFLFVALAVAFVLSPASDAQPAGPAESLEGIWMHATRFGDEAPTPLLIERAGAGWRATFGPAQAHGTAKGENITITFPGGTGEFRGRLIESGRAIRGFWLAPARTTDPTRPFASAVALEREVPGRWRGEVRLLPDSFTLYLRIFRDPEGKLLAAFRNPERGDRGGASQFRVAQNGDAVTLTAGEDPANPELTIAAKRAGPDRLSMEWPRIGAIELVRRAPGDVPAYFPRPPGTPYAYRPPAGASDGWRTASAGETGMDEEALASLVRRLIATDPSARRAPLIHSLLVAHKGRLVLEEYFYGFDRDTAHDLRSAGKTYSSVLLGTAMLRGARIGPETRIYELLAADGPFANPDPRKARVTLAHLMTHSAGFACDDNDDNSPGHEDRMSDQKTQPDWWRYTLDLPMAHEPGVRYAYCSGNLNLVGAALTKGTGLWLPELFDRTIAEPLQFGPYHFNLMPSGDGYLGGGAYVRPRDLLKLGQAYLDGGVWNGRRIVAADWVARSTAQAMEISPATTGLDAEQFANAYGGGGSDGLAWHLGEIEADGRAYRTYAASGNGGQLLIVVPELDLAVAFTAENYRQGGIWGRWQSEIVGGMIVPAIRRSARD